jgi:hypothetical protein
MQQLIEWIYTGFILACAVIGLGLLIGGFIAGVSLPLYLIWG